jgi:hypothetical protein
MIGARAAARHEYLGEKEAARGAPRSAGALANGRLLAHDRGGFSSGGHRLSSLYRKAETAVGWFMSRYFSASLSQKYSIQTSVGVTTPDRLS